MAGISGRTVRESKRIVFGRPEVKFSFGRGVGVVIQKAEKAYKCQRAAEIEKSIAGEFEKITAGKVTRAQEKFWEFVTSTKAEI